VLALLLVLVLLLVLLLLLHPTLVLSLIFIRVCGSLISSPPACCVDIFAALLLLPLWLPSTSASTASTSARLRPPRLVLLRS
jgi:hypothetical protein